MRGGQFPHSFSRKRVGSSPFCSSACLSFRRTIGCLKRRLHSMRLPTHPQSNLSRWQPFFFFNKGDPAHLRTHCGSLVITLSSFVKSSSRHNHEIYPHRTFFIKEPLGCGDSPSFVLFPAHGSSRLPALNGSILSLIPAFLVYYSHLNLSRHLYTSAVPCVGRLLRPSCPARRLSIDSASPVSLSVLRLLLCF